jgi:cytochrome c553
MSDNYAALRELERLLGEAKADNARLAALNAELARALSDHVARCVRCHGSGRTRYIGAADYTTCEACKEARAALAKAGQTQQGE